MGARNVEPVNGGGDWIVTKADHWMFEGTGIKNGDAIPGLIGWEYHGQPADIPGLEIVAAGTRLAEWRQSSTVDSNHLSRTQKQLCIQCIDNLLGAGVESSTGTHSAVVTLESAPWSR